MAPAHCSLKFRDEVLSGGELPEPLRRGQFKPAHEQRQIDAKFFGGGNLAARARMRDEPDEPVSVPRSHDASPVDYTQPGRRLD